MFYRILFMVILSYKTILQITGTLIEEENIVLLWMIINFYYRASYK